jgi:hypothetical protein
VPVVWSGDRLDIPSRVSRGRFPAMGAGHASLSGGGMFSGLPGPRHQHSESRLTVPLGEGPDGVLKTPARPRAEHKVNLGTAPDARLDRSVLAALRAVTTAALAHDFVVILKDQLPNLAVAPVVVDLNGILAVSQRIDA